VEEPGDRWSMINGQKQLPSADEKPQIRVDTEENK
jgi:hypothetical protein